MVAVPRSRRKLPFWNSGTGTKDGRTIAVADAYFQVGKPGTPLVRREQEDRSAVITVRSELPSLPVASSPIVVSAGIGRPLGTQERSGPVIDWARTPQGLDGDDSDSGKKDSRKVKGGWLAEFLGLKKSAHTDLAQQTGLKVTLDRHNSDHHDG
jgi:hypothetical protein